MRAKHFWFINLMLLLFLLILYIIVTPLHDTWHTLEVFSFYSSILLCLSFCCLHQSEINQNAMCGRNSELNKISFVIYPYFFQNDELIWKSSSVNQREETQSLWERKNNKRKAQDYCKKRNESREKSPAESKLLRRKNKAWVNRKINYSRLLFHFFLSFSFPFSLL